jgi:hypothetical protein
MPVNQDITNAIGRGPLVKLHWTTAPGDNIRQEVAA